MIKKLLVVGNLLVIAAVAYTAVNVFYRYALATLPPVEQKNRGPETVQVTVPPRTSGQRFEDYQVVMQKDLFQTVPPKEEPKEDPLADLAGLEATKLRVKLLGTIVSERDDSYAIIEDQANRNEDLYTEGDVVQGATVKKIYWAKVVLRRGGKDEILLMEDEEMPAAASGETESESTAQFTIKRSDMEQHLMNLPRLMSQVRVRPSFDQGQPNGLSVSRIRPGSIFAQMGIQNGDVIQGVNGKDIKSVEDIMNLYRGLRHSDKVDLQVKRGDNTETLTYEFQ